MKILLTGGGSGGHFYPLMSVAQQIRKISEDKKLLQPDIFYVAEKPYDADLLFKNDIQFRQLSSGKRRGYFSILNFFDFFKTGFAIIRAFFLLFFIFPDVIFTNGGYGAFPILFVSRLFRIPVVLHVSDTVPGKVSSWSSKFAKKISIAFPEASEYLEKESDKIAFTGNPVRRGLNIILEQGAHEFLKLDKNVPTLMIIGGSQGAQIINDVVVDALPKLVEKYQVIHQTGKNNFEEVSGRAKVVLQDNENKDRYKPFPYLDLLAMRMSAGASDLIISRAGAGSIAEISVWGLPSIIVPITNSSGDHQRRNAFSYERSGASVVMEEKNLTPNLLISEIDMIMKDEKKRIEMSESAKKFARLDAAEKIAEGILSIGLGHEK